MPTVYENRFLGRRPGFLRISVESVFPFHPATSIVFSLSSLKGHEGKGGQESFPLRKRFSYTVFHIRFSMTTVILTSSVS
jgi:hypothetical protein